VYFVTRSREFPGNMLRQSTVQSVLENETDQLQVVKAWRFPARIHSKTNQEAHQGACS